MKQLFTIAIAAIFAVSLSAQSAPNYFTAIDDSQIMLPFGAETINMPADYQAYSLDLPAMRNHLRNAPAEGSAAAKSGSFRLQIPMADGHFETFMVWESSVMHPTLAAKYPMIKSFAGQSVEDPVTKIRLGYGPNGFRAMVKNGSFAMATLPLAKNQTTYYLCANVNDLLAADGNLAPPACAVQHEEHQEEAPLDGEVQDEAVSFRGGGEGNLVERHDYMFALACTGEFANLYNNSLTNILDAFNTSTEILNLIYEPEQSIRVILVPNADELIFLDEATDPYNQEPFSDALFGQNEAVLNQKVGSSNYDIGHVFTGYPCNVSVNGNTVGIGGQAGGRFCSGNKAYGYTCHASNNIVSFTYSTAAHELAHQLSASHSFSNCPGTYEFAVAASNAYEPGSGSTIMSYQGACPDNNIPGPAGLYYHGSNIEEIWDYVHNGTGNTCPTLVPSSNFSPEVVLPYEDGFFIPISTPFELTANATDANGDALTYCWEQMDLGPQTTLGMPAGTSPSFRSYAPVASPKRVFPRLPVILSNSSEVVEVLPTYSRDLNFRCTVRDNNTTEGAGGVTWEDVMFKSTVSAGPFLVSYPNSSTVVWKAGEQVTVTWDVANTDNALVNCKTVNIKLSVDGGLNFNYSLITSTPNDGSETVFVPGLTTSTARIRVEAADNIFFDLSNQNFQIEPADEPGFTLTTTPQFQQVCVPEDATLELQTGSILNFDAPIEFTVESGLPAGIDVDFSNNPVTPGQSTTMNLDMSSVTSDGFFTVVVKAVAGADTAFQTLYLNLVYNDFSALELLSPTDGQSDLSLLPVFSWTDLPQADVFDFELSTSPTFEADSLIEQASGIVGDTYTPTVSLDENTVYFWRVRPSNECGQAAYSSVKAFQTFTVQCSQFPSTDVPANIPSVGNTPIISSLTILQSGVISDVNVNQIKGDHDLVKHLRVSLISPAGTEVKLFENICGNVSLFNIGLNDEAAFDIQCPPIGGVYKPQEPLSAFIGENTIGDWQLKTVVIDPAGQGGTIEKWSLEFCASTSPNGPYLVNNDTIYVDTMATRPIFPSDLAVEDIDNISSELRFTIVEACQHGFISRNGVPLEVGDHFTMFDIHALKMAYTNTDGTVLSDFFTFVVEDGTGGWIGTPRMTILIEAGTPVNVKEPKLENKAILIPNPASNKININFMRPLTGDTKLYCFDVQGRLVSTTVLEADVQQYQMDLSGFNNGVYFLNISTPNGVISKKFVVEK